MFRLGSRSLWEGGGGRRRGYRRQNRRLYWISFGAEMKKRKSRRKEGSLILTKVAISEADVIEHERETKSLSLSLSFCISRRLPLILISSSSFFSFMKSAISSLSCLSLLLSSASLPPLPINLFFSLRSSGPRNEQCKSIGWHCGFVPTPAVLRSSTLVSAPVPSEEMKKRRVFVRYSLFLLLLFLGTNEIQIGRARSS